MQVLNQLLCCLIVTANFISNGKSQNNELDVHFILIGKTNRLSLTPQTIQYVNANESVVIIIHGYTSGISQDLNLLKIALKYRDIFNRNVIFVDWSESSQYDYFTTIYHTISVVAAQLGKMIITLIKHNIDVKRMHIIGHSLGAHIGGSASRYVQANYPNVSRIHRITALDPAGPLLRRIFAVFSNPLSLSNTDADIVDVTHTNGLGFGLPEPIGTIDFYLNGGYVQSVCGEFSDYNWIGRIIINICSHSYSTIYYMLTINNTDYKASRTSNGCNELVIYGDLFNGEATGIYYLATESEYPYKSLC